MTNTPNTFQRGDALLRREVALPAAGASATTDPIDLGDHGGSFLTPCEALIELPVLTAGQLPVGKLVHAEIQQSDDGVTFETPLMAKIPVVVGAVPAGGAAEVAARFRFPTNVKRHVRAVLHADAGTDLASVTGTFRLAF